MNMKQVVLLRHGESVWNKENRFTGWTDVGLSDLGGNVLQAVFPAPGSGTGSSSQRKASAGPKA